MKLSSLPFLTGAIARLTPTPRTRLAHPAPIRLNSIIKPSKSPVIMFQTFHRDVSGDALCVNTAGVTGRGFLQRCPHPPGTPGLSTQGNLWVLLLPASLQAGAEGGLLLETQKLLHEVHSTCTPLLGLEQRGWVPHAPMGPSLLTKPPQHPPAAPTHCVPTHPTPPAAGFGHAGGCPLLGSLNSSSHPRG